MASATGSLTWEKEGEMAVAAGLLGQPFGAAAGGTHKGKRDKRGKEGRREKSGMIFFVSEGRSTHNPNTSFYFIYLLIYLFIHLGSSSCEAQLRNSPSCAHTF